MRCELFSLLAPNPSLLTKRRVSVSTRYFLFDRQVCTANTLTRQSTPCWTRTNLRYLRYPLCKSGPVMGRSGEGRSRADKAFARLFSRQLQSRAPTATDGSWSCLPHREAAME